MRFRQEFGTSGGSWNPAIIIGGWSAWEPYSATKALDLTISPSNPYGEGTHWVTAEFNADVTEPVGDVDGTSIGSDPGGLFRLDHLRHDRAGHGGHGRRRQLAQL